jgi:hypothetical protein
MPVKMTKPVLKIVCLLPAAALVLLCISLLASGAGTFVIKAGNHSSNHMPVLRFYRGNPSVSFKYRLDEGALAANGKNGISKIYGFSEGHHQRGSSARLGFIVKDNAITARAYCYVDGVSPQKNESQKPEIDRIEVNRWYSCRISREGDCYVFNHDGKETKVTAGRARRWGYLLFPYVGGTFTLDRDLKIEIELLPR